MKSRSTMVLITAIICFLVAGMSAQAEDGVLTTFDKPAVTEEAATKTTSTPAARQGPKPVLNHGLDRWLDLNSFNYSTRFRGIVDANGAHTFNQGQQKLIANGRFKFDERGRYGLGFHLSSGRYFNWAYADFTAEANLSFCQRRSLK